jgi:hypothetical protein
MGWYVSAHDGACADDRSFTNPHVRQDDTVRSNEHVAFNYYFTVALRPPRPPVKVSEDGGPKTDGAVVADGHIIGMQLVDIDELGNKNVLSDFHPTQAMQPWPEATSPWEYKGYFMD